MEIAERAGTDHEPQHKQAACFECRRSKTKCVRVDGGLVCRKCQASGSECVAPAYHVGRYKGVKNKRSGLEKAISQVEQAIKRTKKSDTYLENGQEQALEQLLRQTDALSGHQHSEMTSPATQPTLTKPFVESLRADGTSKSDDTDETLLSNADNPLQLLAVASAVPGPSSSRDAPSSDPKSVLYSNDMSHDRSDEPATHHFFQPLASKLDTSSQSDPIELGLVTEAEAHHLFGHFHSELAHTRWGMDPAIHDVAFVRSRSAFLFTSVMASSALFLDDTAALSKRLQDHVKRLVQRIAIERCKSVEIVLAYMINIPWLAPGATWSGDDDTCHYISLALTVALDLMLNRIVLPSTTIRSSSFLQRLSRADSIDARRALNVDGFLQVDPSSELGKRLLRTRERVWLSLLNLDRGVCLARGRPPTVPHSPLVSSCDTWHISDIADQHDGELVCSTTLRRDFPGLIHDIRSTCDSRQLTIAEGIAGSTAIIHMREQIEEFFERWSATWHAQVQLTDGSMPPYVEILASHTKLSAYCSVINHPTAPPDVKQFFRTAGVSSALNVLKVAVKAETRLRTMPNNTVIMVAFAACFVLGLAQGAIAQVSTTLPAAPLPSRVLMPFGSLEKIKFLIQEVAEVLERIGSKPKHRNGASALFGKHLQTILRKSTASGAQVATPTTGHREGARESRNPISSSRSHDPPRHLSPWDLSMTGHLPEQTAHAPLPATTGLHSSYEPWDFPLYDMTDEQILESINLQKETFDALDTNFSFDDNFIMDWLEPWS